MASFYPKTQAEVPFLTELEFCSKVAVVVPSKQKTRQSTLLQNTRKRALPEKFVASRSR